MTDQAAPHSAPSRPTVRLQAGRHKRVQHGHPWIYSNEIQMDNAAKAIPPGSIVRVLGHDGTALGVASFNSHPLISARMLSRDPDAVIDRAFLEHKLAAALALRDRLYDRPFYRLIHAEADGLPALVVDRFGDVLTVQANAAWIDRLEEELLAALDAVVRPSAIVLRNDTAARGLEGLPTSVRVARGTIDGPVPLEENGVTFLAGVIEGQKTGWFYDQRDNRAFIAGLARGARVIDFYSYTGSFALQCAAAGAASVVAVDRSEPALALAAEAASRNGLADRCSFRRADCFDEMERLAAAGERFDIVIADPPAFVKSRKDLQVGSRAYRKMARLAASLVAPGGLLLAASCSHNVEPPLFAEQIARGLADAHRTGRILRFAGAAPDHPVHPVLPESAYLKAQVLQLD